MRTAAGEPASGQEMAMNSEYKQTDCEAVTDNVTSPAEVEAAARGTAAAVELTEEPGDLWTIKKVVTKYRDRWTVLKAEDEEDLIQEARISWNRAARSFEGRNGAKRETYLTAVVINTLRDISKSLRAESRRALLVAMRFDKPVAGRDGTCGMMTLGDTIPSGHQWRQPRATDAPREIEASQTAFDLERVYLKLSPRDQRVFRALQHGIKKADIARAEGMAPSLLSYRLKVIGRACEAAGYGRTSRPRSMAAMRRTRRVKTDPASAANTARRPQNESGSTSPTDNAGDRRPSIDSCKASAATRTPESLYVSRLASPNHHRGAGAAV